MSSLARRIAQEKALSPLQWMAPELVRAGLVRNEAYVEPNATRAIKLYVNQGLHIAASLLAALHPRAIDYLEQAPVLVLAATYGGKVGDKRARAYVGMNFGPLIERGVRLREVMATYKVAYPLRALSGNSLTPGRWPLIRDITELVDPSSISQSIPADPKKHMFWLNDLSSLWAVIERRLADRGPDFRATILRWAMFALSRAEAGKRFPKDIWGDVAPGNATPAEIGDFLVAEPDRFNPRWTWERMVEETRIWHESIANADLQSADLRGGRYDDEVDYGRFPVHHQLRGYDFHALRSLRALIVEGRAMRHCVASYYRDVAAGRCRIYSISKGGRRIATAELLAFPNPRAVQVKGVCNMSPPKEVRDAADAFAALIGNPDKLATSLGRDLPWHQGDVQ